MSIYFDTLESLKQRKELVDLYRDHLSSESLTGFVTEHTEEFVYLSLVSAAGLSNGIAVVFSCDVTRVRWGGNTRQSIQQLFDLKKSTPLGPALRLESLKSVLESINRLFGYVNVLTERMREDVTFIGEIDQIDETSLLLHEFGTMSGRDRHHMLLTLEQVTRVDAEAPYEKDIKLLFSS